MIQNNTSIPYFDDGVLKRKMYDEFNQIEQLGLRHALLILTDDDYNRIMSSLNEKCLDKQTLRGLLRRFKLCFCSIQEPADSILCDFESVAYEMFTLCNCDEGVFCTEYKDSNNCGGLLGGSGNGDTYIGFQCNNTSTHKVKIIFRKDYAPNSYRRKYHVGNEGVERILISKSPYYHIEAASKKIIKSTFTSSLNFLFAIYDPLDLTISEIKKLRDSTYHFGQETNKETMNTELRYKLLQFQRHLMIAAIDNGVSIRENVFGDHFRPILM